MTVPCIPSHVDGADMQIRPSETVKCLKGVLDTLAMLKISANILYTRYVLRLPAYDVRSH